MKRLWLTLTILGLTVVTSLTTGAPQSRTPSDVFEDGVINGSLWVVGGGARGTWVTDPIGTGSWQYSHEEVRADDGYLQARVWGPESGNTFGGEAWVRTATNFNDGKSYTISFVWEPQFADDHYNWYYIQITDGFIPEYGDLHWPMRWPPSPPITENDLSGTRDLLWGTTDEGDARRGWTFENEASTGKVKWSITIAPEGVARLYSGPSGRGSLLYETTLDPTKPWYVRFMVSDGTSAGFPAGDAQLRLYSFASKCTSSR